MKRRYRGNSLILETTFETASGVVALIDFMPINETTGRVDIIRLVEGRAGSVPMTMELVPRLEYGEVLPTIKIESGTMRAVGGPDSIVLHTPLSTMKSEQRKTVAEFVVSEGETVPFTLIRSDSFRPEPDAPDPIKKLEQTEAWWNKWTSRCLYNGAYREAVMRSLITLKALTFSPTGAIVAAPTTSLPERLGGTLNWDYRYCWLRDATFTLNVLLKSGYREEAIAWHRWLMHTAAVRRHQLQTVYGLRGEQRLEESELSHLPGYDDSSPVRIGNHAYQQFQLDIYGEVLNALYTTSRYDIEIDDAVWLKHCDFLDFLATAWHEPDDGIWETRSGRRDFTWSKVSAWIAFNRAVRLIDERGLPGPREKWHALCAAIHADVCAHGYDRKRRSFVQSYGSGELDAALLLLPLRGFLPASDPRIVSTVAAIQSELMEGGLVKRFHRSSSEREGAFLPCTFWLVDCLVAMERTQEAKVLFERALGLCNDVGLLSEEYDCQSGRLVGNFPQALSHLALVNSACSLAASQSASK